MEVGMQKQWESSSISVPSPQAPLVPGCEPFRSLLPGASLCGHNCSQQLLLFLGSLLSPCKFCTNNTCIPIVTETHFCFVALCKQMCVRCGPQRGSCKPSIGAHSYGVSQLLVLHMLMKTNSRLSGDTDWLMFDEVAIKKHGRSPTTGKQGREKT